MNPNLGRRAKTKLRQLQRRVPEADHDLKTSSGSNVETAEPPEPLRSPQVVFETALPRTTIASLQKGILEYTYKEIKTWKSPFDLALYQLVLSRVRPRSIVEFGTKFGGSALWFADMLANHGIQGHVYSFDNRLDVNEVRDDRITFSFCDVTEPAKYLSDEFMNSLERPILVIDDSSHRYQDVLNILEFVDRWLDEDDYIIIEDGIVDHMRTGPRYEGGTPLKAINEFLLRHPTRYRVDRDMCDFYGTNTTWAVDGYIQPLRERSPFRPAQAESTDATRPAG